MWLAEAASFLAGQEATAESADVNVLQEKQKKLKVKKVISSNVYYKTVIYIFHCLLPIWHFIQLFYCYSDITDA